MVRVIEKPYRGLITGLKHNGSPKTLWLTPDHLVLAKTRPRSLGGHRDWSASPPTHLARRRKLRREMSPPERKLWSLLRNRQLGVKFRRQHPIGPYIADFYSRDVHLVVEVDGSSHFEADAIEYDHERDAYMRTLGLDVLRFTAREVEMNPAGVCLAIHSQCRIRAQSVEGAEWVQADLLQPGDLVFTPPLNPPVDGGKATPSPRTGRAGVGASPVELKEVRTEWSDEIVYDLEIEDAHSFLTEVCAIHNCGSGTTAYVAEQWGRRWITIDVSRVALAIARQRLLMAKFDYYRFRPTSAEDVQRNPDGPWLSDPTGEIQGTCTFDCKTVPHITLKSIAQNPALDPIFGKWEPILAEKLDTLNTELARMVTKELHQRLLLKLLMKQKNEGKRSITDADERRWRLPEKEWHEWEVPFDTDPDWPEELQQRLTDYRQAWREKMDEINACIAARAGQEELVDQPYVDRGKVRVSGPFTLEGVIPAEESILHAEGTWGENDDERQVAVMFGPQYGPLIAPMIEDGIRIASRRGYDDLVFAGFSFDGAAQAAIQDDPDPRVRIHMAQIRPDVTMGDLLKTTVSSQIFTVSGMPRTDLRKVEDGQYVVEMQGVDIYDPVTNTVRSSGAEKVAAWFLDADYDGRCFCITQAFFPDKTAWKKLGKALGGALDAEAFEKLSGTVSLPFPVGQHKRVAVKVIDPRGNEVLRVHRLGKMVYSEA